MKKLKKNSLILLFITAFLLWYILKDSFTNSIKTLLSANICFVLLSLLVYLINFYLEAIVLKKLVNQYNKNYTIVKTLKLCVYTKFFNGITPFATGGQPLQVYELKKEGIKSSNGTVIIVEHFIVFQVAIVILAFIGIILNSIFHFIKCEPFLNILTIIGFAINIILLIIVILISKSKTFAQRFLGKIIKFLAKIKIVRDESKALDKMGQACQDYYLGYQNLGKNKKLFIELVLIEIVATIIWFTMPTFIFLALGYQENISLLITILISLYIFFVGSYIPIPGGSGGMEYSFLKFFNYYIPFIHLTPALILWRFLNYYLPILIGGIAYTLKKKLSENNKLRYII